MDNSIFRFCCCLILIVSSDFISAQVAIYDALHLESVSFGNPHFDAYVGNPPPVELKGNIPIMFDNHDGIYNEPQYTEFESKPVAFVSGSYVGISATFSVDLECFPPGTKLYNKPTHINPGIAGLYWPVVECEVQPTGAVYYQELSLPGLPGAPQPSSSIRKVRALFSLIKPLVRFEDTKLEWKYALNPSVLNNSAGISENKFYVTHKTRDAESGVYSNASPLVQSPVPHTVLAVGCIAANFTSGENPIISAITSKFSGLEIQRADDGAKLTYYDQWGTNCNNTEGLLTTSDGQCGSWAFFFLDVMYAQGIDVSGIDTQVSNSPFNYYTVRFGERIASNGGNQQNSHIIPQGFFIHDYDFELPQTSSPWVSFNRTNGTVGLSEVSDYGILLVPAQTPSALNDPSANEAIMTANNQMNWQTPTNVAEPLIDQTGIIGQGITTNPKSIFTNHQFVRSKVITYDPSYGISHGRFVSGFLQSVAAVWFNTIITMNEVQDGVDYNGNTILEPMARVLVLYVDPHPENFEIVPTPATY